MGLTGSITGGGLGLGRKHKSKTQTISDNSNHDLITVDLAEGRSIQIQAMVIGCKSDNTQILGCRLEGTFARAAAGDVTEIGSWIEAVLNDNSIDFHVTFYVDTTNQRVCVRVQDGAANTVKWVADVIYSMT